MKLYLVIVLVLCGSYADDELPEDFASLLSQLSDDFNLQLQKRLTDLDPDLSLQDKDHKVDKAKLLNDKGSTCFYQVSEQRIIRTHDSLNNGATYIDSPTDIQNVTACRAECCSRSECDLAVFKDKGDEHACYLFACSGACLFTNHTGFTTMEKHRMAQQHEDDLANLATDPPSTLKPATTAATTKTTETSSTTPSPDKVPLFGACIEDSDCAESKAECLAGYCVCQQGSHAQEGVCREECSRFQFECANEGKPLSYPQCIAIYDTCDGIPHCRDGSDELKCEPRGISSSDSKSVGVENSYDELASLVEELLKSEDNDGAGRKTQNQGSAQPGIDNGYQNRRPVNAGGKGLPSRPQAPEQRINPNQGTQGRVPERDGTYRTDPQRPYLGNRDNSRAPDSSALGRQNQQPAGQNKPDYDSAGKQKKLQPNVPMPPPQNAQSNVPAEVPKSTNNDKNNGAPETPTPAQPTPEPTGTTAQPAAAATGAPAGLKTSSAPVTATQSSSGEHKKPDHSGNAGAAVASKHVAPEVLLNDAEKEPALKASNKTAVVVLAMGLAVTALLLIFVGCRLRMVKRRLRRGRPLNSNEADYLINGMYL